MAGPGGQEVGRVSIRVVPDTSRFRDSLRAFLAKEEARHKLKINIEPETKGFSKQLRAFLVSQRGRHTLGVKIEPDTRGFIGDVRAFLRVLRQNLELRIPVKLDLSKFHAELALMQARADSVELRVRARIYGLRTSLQQELAAARKTNPTIFVQARVSKAGMRLLARDVSSAGRDGRILSAARRVGEAIGNAMTGGLRASLRVFRAALLASGLSVLTLAAIQATQALLSVSAGILDTVGALALLPAVAATGALGIGALALGLQGLGDALKEVGEGGDAAKLEAALGNLAPAAREFVGAVQEIAPAFKAMRLDTQQRLFRGFGDELRVLARSTIPILTDGLGRVADSINRAVLAASQDLRSGQGLADLAIIVANAGEAFRAFEPALRNLLAGIRDLAVVGSAFLPGLAEDFTGLTARFRAWAAEGRRTGKTAKDIRDAFEAIGNVVSIVIDFGRALNGLANAAEKAGGPTLKDVATGMRGLADSINSVSGQEKIVDFFHRVDRALQPIQDALPNFTEGLRNLGPVIETSISGSAEVFGAFLDQLGTAFQNPQVTGGLQSFLTGVRDGLLGLAPAIPPVLAGITALGPGFGRLASSIGNGLGRLLGEVGKNLEFLAPAFNAAAGAVASFVDAGVGVAVTHMQNMRDALQDMNDSGQFEKFRENLELSKEALGPGFQPAAEGFRGFLSQIGPPLEEFANKLLERVGPAIRQISEVFGRDLLPAIGTFMAAIGPVAGFFIDVLGRVALIALQLFVDVLTGVLEQAAGVLNIFSALVTGNWSAFWSGIRQIATGQLRIVGSVIAAAFRLIVSIISGGLRAAAGFATSGFAQIATIGLRAMLLLGKHVASGIASAVKTIGTLGSRAVSALGDLGGLLVGAGKALVQGFIDGIRAMFKPLQDAVNGLLSIAARAVPGSPIKEGPLKPWNRGGVGKALVQLLADGLRQTGPVDAAVNALTGRIASPRAPGVSGLGGVVGGPGVAFYGDVYTQDPDELARQIRTKQRDALAVFGLSGAALGVA